MLPLRQVLICSARSDLVVKAAKYVATMNPNMTYHVVSVVPTHKSRLPITPLLRNTFVRMAQEAVHEVELALMEHRVLAVRKAILYGRPEEELLRYAVTYSIDLIAITSSVTESPPRNIVGTVTKAVIMRAPTPVFVYTSTSPPPPKEVRNVAILVEGKGEISGGKVGEVLEWLATPSLRVRLLCYHSGKYCSNVLNAVKIQGKVEDVLVDHVPPGKEYERLDWVVRSVEGEHLLVIGKGGGQRVSKGFTLLGGRRLPMRENVLAGLSPAPVLMV